MLYGTFPKAAYCSSLPWALTSDYTHVRYVLICVYTHSSLFRNCTFKIKCSRFGKCICTIGIKDGIFLSSQKGAPSPSQSIFSISPLRQLVPDIPPHTSVLLPLIFPTFGVVWDRNLCDFRCLLPGLFHIIALLSYWFISVFSSVFFKHFPDE